MLLRILALVVLLGAATLFYRWWQGRQGTVRRVERPGALTPAILGSPRGARATFVQFSTPMCAKCPGTAVLLKRVAAEQPHVAWIEIDASPVTRASAAADPWPITASPDNFVLVVAGGGHPTNSYWLQGYSPGVVGRAVQLPGDFARLLAEAGRDLGG